MGTAASGRICGAGAGEMGAGLQMDDAGMVTEEEVLRRLEEDDKNVEEELDVTGGVNWPLLSEPLLSLDGDDFFFIGLNLVSVLLLCCCRHFARRFLNQT